MQSLIMSRHLIANELLVLSPKTADKLRSSQLSRPIVVYLNVHHTFLAKALLAKNVQSGSFHKLMLSILNWQLLACLGWRLATGLKAAEGGMKEAVYTRFFCMLLHLVKESYAGLPGFVVG